VRILSVATTHPRFVGDSEPAYVLEINRELVRLGHQVTTLLPHADGAAASELVDGVDMRRFRYFFPASLQRLCYNGGILPNLRRSRWARANLPFFLPAQGVAVARTVRQTAPDLVHCHWLISSGLMGVLFGGVHKRPVVVSAHGSDVYIDNLLFQTVNRFVLARCHTCTVNSDGTRSRVARIHPGMRSEVVPMGVHPEDYGKHLASAEIRERLGGGDPQLLFIGRFSEHKGIPHLVAAMPEILRQLPRARLVLVGFGPEEPAIRRSIAASGLDGVVRFAGRISHAEVPSFLASADLVVLPSVQVEGLGVVLLEALASGTPVVGSRVGGIPDVIRDGETGLLALPGDPEDLARRCLRLLGDEALRRRTVEAGRRMVETQFSWASIAERFDGLFRACVADPTGGASHGRGPARRVP
jgi:phosphatidyl-myo-inositol dimannoside synthase